MLLVAACLAGSQVPHSASPSAALMQRLPYFISSVGSFIGGAPLSASQPSPACNISYTPVTGPHLTIIAAQPRSGMLWGVGYGVEAVPEPWMEVVPPRREDATWVCGGKKVPCLGKWQLLHELPGIQGLAADEAGYLAAIDGTGKHFLSKYNDKFDPIQSDWSGIESTTGKGMGSESSLAMTDTALFSISRSGGLQSLQRNSSTQTRGRINTTPFRSISVQPSTDILWAVTEEGGVLHAPAIKAEEWDQHHPFQAWEEVPVPTAMKSVIATLTAIRGVAVDGTHLKCALPCIGKWMTVPGSGGKLAEGGDRLWHLSDSGQLSVSQAC